MEGLANRDSLGYIDQYKLQDDGLETMMRGTLRYEGFSEVMDIVAQLGLLGDDWRHVPESVKLDNKRALDILEQLSFF